MRRTILSATTTAATTTKQRIKTYNMKAAAIGSSCTSRTGSGHLIPTDVPVKSGGRDSAAEPVYHLLAALVGCKAATGTFVARKMNINVREMTFDLEASRNEMGALALPIDKDPTVPAALSHIVGVCYVDAPGITDQELEMFGKQTTIRCPVANMIQSSGTVLKIHYEKKYSTDEIPGDGFLIQ